MARERQAGGGAGPQEWQQRWYDIIFLSDSRRGQAFDLVLLMAIVCSVLAVVLDSVPAIRRDWHAPMVIAEWFFTILFTLEYLLRLSCVRRPKTYARSFFGIVDLLSILPTWLSLVIPGAHHLLVLRLLRLMRIFRVLKLARYVGAGDVILQASRASWPKILIFLIFVGNVVVVLGAAMYLVEGKQPESPFTSIPIGIYWAIVTMSTVGYGDVVPQTVVGKAIASVVMLLGYGVLAVPTGIVSSEMINATRHCPHCGKQVSGKPEADSSNAA